MIAAIDPGTHCGWSVFDKGAPRAWGTWELKGRKPENSGLRYLRMRRNVISLLTSYPEITKIGYEDVKRHLGTIAAHTYGGIVAHLTAAAEELGVPYIGIAVGTVKKRATGSGNSDKAAMIAAALKQWPHIKTLNDNEADALWIGVCTSELI